MAIVGLGNTGYVWIQKESVYGTAASNSKTFLDIKSAKFSANNQEIERKNVIGSRLKRTPVPGRSSCTFELEFELNPAQIGLILNLLLGASLDTLVSTGIYRHLWFTPASGVNVGKSFTIGYAEGGELETRLAGSVLDQITISVDNEGILGLKISGKAQSATFDISRATPVYSSASPLIFSMANLKVDNNNDPEFSQVCNSIELEIKLNHLLENYGTGSRTIYRPVFQSIPELMLKANIQADKSYQNFGRGFVDFGLKLEVISEEFISGSTPYLLSLEMPKCRLKPDTEIPIQNDLTLMDLEFNCSYGGSSTNSSGVAVIAEAIVRDGVSAYA